MKFPDHRLRKFLVGEARREIALAHCDTCLHSSSMLVSTCEYIGIGCRKDQEAARATIGRVGLGLELIESQINFLRSEETQMVYNNWVLRILVYYGLIDFGILANIDEIVAEEAELSQELAGVQTVLGPSHNIAFQIRERLGLLAEERRDWRRACDIYVDLITENDKAHGYGPSHPTTILLRISLSNCLCALGQDGSAAKCALLAHRSCLENAQIGRDHPLTALALEVRGRLHETRGEWSQSERFLRLASKIKQRFYGDRHPRTLQSQFNLGEVLLSQRKLPRLEKLSRSTYRAALGVIGADHPDTLAYLVQHLQCLHFLGRLEEVETRVITLLDRAVPRLSNGHPVMRDARYLLGLNYFEQQRWKLALPLLEEALHSKDSQKSALRIDRDTNSAMQSLAILYSKIGRLHDARELLEQARDNLQRGGSGLADSPDKLLAAINLAGVLYDLNAFDDAEELGLECLAKCMKRLGAQNWITILCMGNLSDVYSTKELHTQAELLCRLVVQHTNILYGRRSSETVASLSQLASHLHDSGDCAQAVETQLSAYQESCEILGPRHPETVRALRQLAEMRFAEGKEAQSLELVRQVLADQRALAGDDDSQTLNDAFALSFVQEAAGQDDAAAHLQKLVMEKIATLSEDVKLECLQQLLEVAANYHTRAPLKESAFQFLRRVLEAIRHLAGSDSDEALQATYVVGGMCLSRKMPSMAVQLYREALNSLLQQHAAHHDDYGEEGDGLEIVGAKTGLAISLAVAGRLVEAAEQSTEAVVMAERKEGNGEGRDVLAAAASLAFSVASSGDWNQAKVVAVRYLSQSGKHFPAATVSTIASGHDIALATVAQLALWTTPRWPWDDLFCRSGFGGGWEDAKRADEDRKLRDWALKIRRLRIPIF
jgi:tetratricopeptide (TPR) repeat protein